MKTIIKKAIFCSFALAAGAQAQSITQHLPLDLMALNNPGELAGLAIAAKDGKELGRVVEIVRKNSDQSLQVIISTSNGSSAAIRLDELTVAALSYFDPAQSLGDQVYETNDFEQISQYQAGHSARGSLANPEEVPLVTELDEQREPPASQAREEQQTQADSTLEAQSGQSAAAGNTATTGQTYSASGSSIVQMALTYPDALEGKLLIDENGKTLGEIAHIAKNITTQGLYAVINMKGESTQAAVILDALAIGKLEYRGSEESFAAQDFVENEFTSVAGQ